MKILSIKSLNINSLKGLTEIDFALLTKDNALFAITGPTGSGKSTILDIISCALYGRTARLKNPNDLMSRHSGEAFCEVEFEIRGKVYRSSWTQKRARKKHDGTFQTAKMELVDLDEDNIITQKSREVPKKIEELSGLDFSRFTQSMLLAQGGFDAFLKADEKERSILLEKITGTQIYAEISMAIFEKHRGFVQDMESEQKVLESIELLEDDVVQAKNKQLSQNTAQKAKTDKELKELIVELNWVEKLSEFMDDTKKYEKELQKAKKLKEENKESFVKLDLANRALNVSVTSASHNQLQKSVTTDKEKSLQLAKELTTLNEDTKKKDKEYSLVKKEFDKKSIEFQEQNQGLKKAREIQTKEKQTEQSIIKEKVSLRAKEQNLLKLTNDLSSMIEKNSALAVEIDTQNNYLLKNAKDEKLLSTMGVVEQGIKEYKEQTKQLTVDKKELDVLKIRLEETLSVKTLKILEKTVLEIKKHIDTLRDKKVKEQLLKKYEEDRVGLVDGKECYLCGSKEHPYALLHVEVDIDETQALIVSQSKELDSQEKALSEFKINQEKYTTLYEQLSVKVKLSDTKIEDVLNALKRYFKEIDEALHVDKLDTQYDVLVQRYKLYSKAQKTLKTLESDFNRYKLDKKEYETKISSVNGEILALSKKIEELELSMSELSLARVDVLNVADLDIYEKEITIGYKTLQESEQSCKTMLNELTIKQEERVAYKKSLDTKILKDEQALHVVKSELEELYVKYAFKDARELESATLSTEAREELSSLCKGIEEGLKQNQTLQKQSEEKLQEHQAKPMSEKPIQELENLQSLLSQKTDALQESIGSDKKELELNQINSDKHKEKTLSLQKKKESFKVWVKLNELVGSADGTKFKKFAQGITLDQLINLANQHLSILSTRYTLARNQDKLLELEVVDAYQGNVIRPVSTLSGGESFIVSLALALGLSELASQKISIDSLFLDEGFGTLDEESLETALNALNLLQNGGKMVGVISHVEALKERIPLQIRVVPNGDGSSFVEVG